MKLLQTFTLGMLLLIMIFSCSKTLSEEEYYNAAKEAYTKEKFQDAVVNFNKLVENYPDGERAAESSFMLGFINSNYIKNFEEAKKYYEKFIKTYPDHELADDAQYELDTLGKDINELPIFTQCIQLDTTINGIILILGLLVKAASFFCIFLKLFTIL